MQDRRIAALLLILLVYRIPSAFGDPVSCESLTDEKVSGVSIESATPVHAEGDLPAHCLVQGIIAPSIRFEMRLPTDSWNGRFLLAGCGAYCGQVQPVRPLGYSNSIAFALRRGYAATKADSGHSGSSPIDTSWAFNDPTAEVLYAHAWVPLTAAASGQIIRTFYGAREDFSYFSGCSNGGRTAAKVAQMYPTLFDGIASGAPGINATYAAGIQGIWWDRTLVDENGELILTASKTPILAEAVLAHCDHKDGLVDRIVSDPSQCDFDPRSLRCRSDDEAACLTSRELDVVEKLYAGPRDESGRQLYPGLPFGSERYWERWLVGPAHGGRPHVASLGSAFLLYLGFAEDPGSDYDSSMFRLETDIPQLAVMGRLYNATDPDLTSFRNAGGKLLMYHGLADALTLYVESTRYYESVIDHFGNRESVDDFYRLFLVPGMGHCWGVTGYAPDLFDPLSVLEDWVERGRAPEQIEARQHTNVKEQVGEGPVLRTRPLCPYPSRAAYDGTGSPYSATNFQCVVDND